MRKKHDNIKRKGTSLVDARKNKTFKNYRQNMCLYIIYIPNVVGMGKYGKNYRSRRTEVKITGHRPAEL